MIISQQNVWISSSTPTTDEKEKHWTLPYLNQVYIIVTNHNEGPLTFNEVVISTQTMIFPSLLSLIKADNFLNSSFCLLNVRKSLKMPLAITQSRKWHSLICPTNSPKLKNIQFILI